MKHLTAQGRKREVCRWLLKIMQRHAQRQQHQLPGLAKEPQLSLHKRHQKDKKRGD